MGTEEFWVPAVLAAVSAGGEAYNQVNTNSKQQAAETQAIQTQNTDQAKSAAVVNQAIQQSQGSLDSQRAASTADYINTLRRAQATSQLSNPPVAGADPRYTAGTAAANTAANNFGTGLASDLGTVTGTNLSQQQERANLGTSSALVQQQQVFSQQQAYVDKLREASITANPWISLASKLGVGAAGAMASGATAAAPPTYPGLSGEFYGGAPISAGGTDLGGLSGSVANA